MSLLQPLILSLLYDRHTLNFDLYKAYYQSIILLALFFYETMQTVPLFHFYKDGILLEAFPTRDKERITAAISKYTSPASQDTRAS